MVGGGGRAAGGHRDPAPPPDPEEIKLKEALDAADKSVIVFGANLGCAQIGNRNTLSANFTAGLRDAAIGKAGEDATAAAESVRQVADALSCAENVDFVGRTSTAYVRRGEGGAEDADGAAACPPPSYYSMPVRLTFPDRDSRIYFEQTVKKQCGVSAKQDLPRTLRTASADFGARLRAQFPDLIIVVKLDSKRRLFTAIGKKNGCPTWDKLDEKLPITPAMLAGVVNSDSGSS